MHLMIPQAQKESSGEEKKFTISLWHEAYNQFLKFQVLKKVH